MDLPHLCRPQTIQFDWTTRRMGRQTRFLAVQERRCGKVKTHAPVDVATVEVEMHSLVGSATWRPWLRSPLLGLAQGSGPIG
jgi:hypothetical protein